MSACILFGGDAPFVWQCDDVLSGITAAAIGIFLLTVRSLFDKSREVLVLNVLDVLFGVFIVWSTIRVTWAENTFHSWGVLLGGAAVLLYACTRVANWKSFYWDIFWGAGILQALWSAGQQVELVVSNHSFFTGVGGFSNPAILAIFIVIAILAGSFRLKKGKHDVAFYIRIFGISFLLSVLVSLASRAAWVALFFSLVYYFLMDNEKWRERLRGRQLVLLIVLFVFVCLGGCYGLYCLQPASVQGRFLIWQVAISLFYKAPWFGNGSFAASYMPAQAAWLKMHPETGWASVAGNTEYAFNELLRIGCELGLVGLLLFGSILVLIFRQTTKGVNLQARTILLAVLVFGCFSYPFSEELIIAITIIMIAVIAQTMRLPVWKRNLGRALSYGYRILVLLFLLLLGREYYHVKQGDLLLTEVSHGHLAVDNDALRELYGHLNGNSEVVLSYGRMLYNHKKYEQALSVLERGFQLKPLVDLTCELGDCYRHVGKWKEAEEKYHLAACMVPTRVTPRQRLFHLYRSLDRQEEALQEARRILEMKVKMESTAVLRARIEAENFLDKHSIN